MERFLANLSQHVQLLSERRNKMQSKNLTFHSEVQSLLINLCTECEDYYDDDDDDDYYYYDCDDDVCWVNIANATTS